MNKCEEQGVNPERVKALQHWLEVTQTRLRQINGQRKYGGPPEVWKGPPPGAQCEVYISHIPRDVYEDILIPLFSLVGPLWEFRLMMNFSGQNRGFAYAKYGSADVARDVCCRLDRVLIGEGHELKVTRSTEKRRVYVTQLPVCTEQEWLDQVIYKWFDGVERVSLRTDSSTKKAYAIVTFTSHYKASMAKKVVVEVFQKEFQLAVNVQWRSPDMYSYTGFVPPKDPDFVNMQCCTPFQKFLPPHLHPNQLTSPLFCRVVGGPVVSPNAVLLQQNQESYACSSSPATLLRKLCESNWFCCPKYDFSYSHNDTNGFPILHYKVCVPGLCPDFKGMIMIHPGPTATDTMVVAQNAAAEQVLGSLSKMELQSS